MLHLPEDAIFLNLKATNKEGVLWELAAAAHQQSPAFPEEALFQILQERELIGSTGVGNGVAIPHGKITDLKKIILCFGRSENFINFDAVDGKPVQIFFLLLSPATVAGEYLQTLAQVSNVLKKKENREKLLRLDSRQEIATLFREG